MICTVTWLPLAEAKLINLWLGAPDRRAVSAAANNLDILLRTDADQLGESRADDVRVLIEGVLGIYYRVKVDDRLVEVLNVWRIV